MSRVVQTVALIACAGLLLGILLVLVGIGRNGIRIELGGDVNVTGMHDRVTLSMSEPVSLRMDEPGQLVTTGPDGAPIATEISLVPCPECGGTMLPVRWSPWTGEIEWMCPGCDERTTLPASSEP